jgi:AcrR family transcriptional regulator
MSLVSGTETVQDLRNQRRANRRAQNRADILDAAELVFAEDGIRGGSIRRVAEESGFSAAALYLFFENKEQLVSEVLNRRADELIAVIGGVAGCDLAPLDKLHRIIDDTLVFFRERPNFRFLLYHLRGGPIIAGSVLPDSSDPADNRFHQAMTLLSEVVEEGQMTGEIREGDPGVLAHLYSVLINEFVLLDGGPGERSAHAFSSEQFHHLVDGALRSPAN